MRRGFTLVEMMVVVAIIAILAAILIPAITMAKAKVIVERYNKGESVSADEKKYVEGIVRDNPDSKELLGFKGWTKDTYTAEANPYETKTEEAKPEVKPEPDKNGHFINAGGQSLELLANPGTIEEWFQKHKAYKIEQIIHTSNGVIILFYRVN